MDNDTLTEDEILMSNVRSWYKELLDFNEKINKNYKYSEDERKYRVYKNKIFLDWIYIFTINTLL